MTKRATEAMPLIIQIRAKTLGRYALVVGSSVLVGIAIFFGTAFVVALLCEYLIVRNREPMLGDGVAIVGLWWLFGTIFGLTGLILMLRRFWPHSREVHDASNLDR